MKTAEKISERLKFKSDFERINFLSDTFQLDLLHQIVESTGCRRTDIAKKLKVSDSFVSQLFSGDKRMSLVHLASLVYHFELQLLFEIKSKNNCKIRHIGNYSDAENQSYLNTSENYPRYTISDQNEPEKMPCVI